MDYNIWIVNKTYIVFIYMNITQVYDRLKNKFLDIMVVAQDTFCTSMRSA